MSKLEELSNEMSKIDSLSRVFMETASVAVYLANRINEGPMDLAESEAHKVAIQSMGKTLIHVTEQVTQAMFKAVGLLPQIARGEVDEVSSPN